MNVGELKKILNKLPDDARILPDWLEEPGDNDPCVVLYDFAIGGPPGKEYLSVEVGLEYLDDLSEEDDDEWDDSECEHEPIPDDFPVRPISLDEFPVAKDPVTCGRCGLSWDDGVATSYTPTPAGRCPFESFHVEEGSE